MGSTAGVGHLSAARFKADQALADLKNFQRATAEYVFERLYRDPAGSRRFLVADEVGLGKTLVARGVIAKAVEHLWETVKRIDVVYICSNADIARQNINRLRIAGAAEFTLASRLTMLPVQVQDLKYNRLNFVSLTPGTSFDSKSKMGRWEERALLYLLLRDEWAFKGTGPLNVFQGTKAPERFRSAVKEFKAAHTVDEALADAFRAKLRERGELRDLCQDLVQRFAYVRMHIPHRDLKDRSRLIGELRACLASTCVEALEPDLVILDEFQRFKDLLDGEDDAAKLAQNLFRWARGDERARVLLLSATPYKMYTQAHERDTDDHYQDFLRTFRFLSPNNGAVEELEQLLRDYRTALYQVGEGRDPLGETKAELERCLRTVMVRTERLAVSSDRDGMLREATGGPLSLPDAEVRTYGALHRIAEQVQCGDPVEFWKSAPYLLSFMEGYDLKDRLEVQQGHPPSAAAIAEVLRQSTGLSITRRDLEQYAAVDPNNARLRWLMAETVRRGAWRLLWVPPSLPYYPSAGVWSDAGLAGFTKRLVFSSWRVVPRMIAVMMSYAAERAAVSVRQDPGFLRSKLSERLRGPLRFSLKDGQPAGMSALALMYPSAGLGALFDPLTGSSKDRLLLEVRKEARARIGKATTDLGPTKGSGAEDERWYWAAPILLDLRHDQEATRTFMEDDQLATLWSSGVFEDADDTGWERHVQLVRDLIADRIQLGRRPADLDDALVDLALGGPGVCAFRALGRVARAQTLAERVIARREAAQIAWSARNLFNLPENVALLRGINAEEPYWRRVVEYCVAGNLQAVLDEYGHLLVESRGLIDHSVRRIIGEVGKEMRAVLRIRASNPGFDEVVPAGDGFSVARYRARARFALRFGDERSEGEGKEGMRKEQVRQAFNSPFWPFVLATTSVGQEGLDFHPYCHSVVHWNLPSNPVDLEQREGRVHRYKGHAVRKTLADKYGSVAVADHGDPWRAVFDTAAKERSTESELVPYWVHGDPKGYRIERHVPMLPLCRDVIRFERLRRSLALYRMVFGQPRQDDLLAYLAERLPMEEAVARLDACRIDLQPPALQARVSVATRHAARAPVDVEPQGDLGKAIIAVLDWYPLVLGRRSAKREQVAGDLLEHLRDAIEAAGFAEDDRYGWDFEYEDHGRWLPVPALWMWDDRRRVRKNDDLVLELLLDPERDGVYVALSLGVVVDRDWLRMSFQVARRYRDLRRDALRGVTDPLLDEGFVPLATSEFLRGQRVDTSGAALTARFYTRHEMVADHALVAGLRSALHAYDHAYERRLASPDKAAIAILKSR